MHFYRINNGIRAYPSWEREKGRRGGEGEEEEEEARLIMYGFLMRIFFLPKNENSILLSRTGAFNKNK